MELIEAMEAMDGDGSAEPVAAPTAPPRCDFFLQQIYYVHRKLKAQWLRQHRPVKPLHVPFVWVLSKTLRLLEEYPAGLTEAVILTELMAQLHHRERLSIKRARTPTLEETLEENNEAVITATVLSYAQHCVTLQIASESSGSSDTEGSNQPVVARMFLHQRFRSCLAAMASLGATSSEAPFTTGRQLTFTNAKLMEGKSRGPAASKREAVLLQTPYLGLTLTHGDGILQAQALSFGQVDVMASQELPGNQAPSLLQELVVKARVVDISAIRPCTTPYHVQRQVVMLADVPSQSQPYGSPGSHVFILWDDQVALSRLFHVGDTLTILHPFVHVCSPDDAELVSVFEEYSSQQRCAYYLEYGSATTLFISSQQQGNVVRSLGGESRRKELQLAENHSGISVKSARKQWIGFSIYGQVAKIRVSHGIPLLAAFFYSYYDPKTQGQLSGAHRPSLDRAVVSKYYLVVLIDLYDATSNEVRSVELTGATAVKALQLREGQTVFIEGLVAVDMKDDASIRSLRDEKAQLKLLTQAQDERARFAFPNEAYKSAIVALSSDWENIFGSQSDKFIPSRLFLVNDIPGILKTQLIQDRGSELFSSLLNNPVTTRLSSMVSSQFTITRVGWVIPGGDSSAVTFQWDESCERGFSTMLAHRPCQQPLEMASAQAGVALPTWKCVHCNEIFTGMDDTVQTFCDLVVRIDDGSVPHQVIHAVCHGESVSVLLGVPAESFSQLSLLAKRSVLRQSVGKDYRAILSRCPRRHISSSPAASAPTPTTVELRVDQLQPVDTFAAAKSLLAQLQRV